MREVISKRIRYSMRSSTKRTQKLRVVRVMVSSRFNHQGYSWDKFSQMWAYRSKILAKIGSKTN